MEGDRVLRRRDASGASEHGATTGEEHTRNTRGSQATVGGKVDGHATGHIRLEGLH